nr:MAG TPA: hypothetical protein [Caudoviricetes sp.]
MFQKSKNSNQNNLKILEATRHRAGFLLFITKIINYWLIFIKY